MEGGIRAWMGLTAEGPPEAAMAYFSAGTGAADMAALAWALEEATRQFYTRLSEKSPDSEAASLFVSLATAEEHHKGTLEGLHQKLIAEPVSRMYDRQDPKILEGGMEMDAALRWSEGKPVTEVLDLALGLEANAYDRYLRMLDISENEHSREVFRSIALEEKGHLKRLSDLMDEQIMAVREGR